MNRLLWIAAFLAVPFAFQPDRSEASTSRKAAPTAVKAAAAVSASTDSAMRVPPSLFLSWRAPHGVSRAVENVVIECSGEASPETLYVSYDPGQSSETFIGMDISLYFRATRGDSLSSYWSFGGGTMNRRNIRIEFPADSSWGLPRGFRAQGMGAPNYRRTRESGQLEVIFAVPLDQAAPIRPGQVYCFARIIFPAASPMDENCGQPVCIEFQRGEFSFSEFGDGTSVLGRPVRRFASWNSPASKVCAEFRAAPGSWTR
ncbi:MAG: hypothetical protein HOP12_07810 [Candidatus Eisenbacteria bacterium]|uniref:Uncharacterized protein n=1 Tax=Eiseniibacteriota bacterium TaxID=2212470 RepID=A0A849SRP5_UNCEI|nr:hypothetical protein [Candidatus Eisenbacteria bacterium]